MTAITRRRGRTAASPVIAELALMAVTIVAAGMVGSWGFQVSGVYTHVPEVEASFEHCTMQGTNETCVLRLVNIGSDNAQTIPSCALGSHPGVVLSGGTVIAGGSLDNVKCYVEGYTVSQGSLVSGWVGLANGAHVYFFGSV